ncbi:MAG TPA: hypothetical protein DCL44_01140 [Elusimicrobia bacterium]|nr:hypothetical protein [Elusimicrobiota bacterium]
MQGTGPAAPPLKTIVLAAGLSLFAACAVSRPDIIQVGPWSEPRSWKQVPVLISREQITRPWGGVAIIHSKRIPAGDSNTIERQKFKARKMAAKIGADAIIITVGEVPSGPELGVYQEPEIYLSALAIKYVTSVSTATQEQN